MAEFSLGMLRNLWPHADQHIPGLAEGIAAAAPTVFPKYGLDTPIAIALWWGQASEECGAGLEMVESLNYSAEGLRRTFPTHFTGTMAERYAHNQRMIGDVAYGGRMGNAPPPSDDGYNYRGRGLSQVTGKEGYEKLQAELTKNGVDIDILSDPGLICDPRYTLECGVADFVLCGCLPFAKAGNVLETTRKLNGGTNGLAERQHWTTLWLKVLNP
jgi:putative chitinase